MTRRIIAVSSSTAVPAGADADVWVVERDRLAEIPGSAPIVVIGTPSASELTALMQAHERVVGFARDLAAGEALAARVLAPVALQAELAPGTELHVRTVADHEDKTALLAALAPVLPAKLRDAVEQSVDELVMNALYAAPVAADGQRVFAKVSVRERIARRTQETVRVTYGLDPQRFVVEVKDAFGSLERATLQRVLHKGVHAEDKVDQRAGGAGLGMYLVASAASATWIEVTPGVETVVTCVFERVPQHTPQLAFIKRAGDARAKAARVLRSAAARARIAKLAFGAVGAVALAGLLVAAALGPDANAVTIIASPGTTIDVAGRAAGRVGADGALRLEGLPPGRRVTVIARAPDRQAIATTVRAPATLELALPTRATVELVTVPPGAIVERAGIAIGVTPLAVPAGESLEVAKPGYQRATVTAGAPITLVRAPELARVRIESVPAGAAIVVDGQAPGADRTFTPAEIFVEAGKRTRLSLVMADRAASVEAAGTDGEVLTATLE